MKNTILQILVNLIHNSKDALANSDKEEKILKIRVNKADDDHLKIEVEDNGVGIPEENLTRIFRHGFTTKQDGHGYGLHSGALAAKTMGGSLTVQSEGVGKGVTFTLELPFNVAEVING